MVIIVFPTFERINNLILCELFSTWTISTWYKSLFNTCGPVAYDAPQEEIVDSTR